MTYAEQNHYDKLSKFQSLKEFNNHLEQAMIYLKGEFTKSEYIALKKLSKFAADFFGVAWCKAQKAVAATHMDALIGVSRSSFDRMLRKAKKFNLITVINQYRKNNKQKHNVYVFNRVEEIQHEVVEIVPDSHTIDAPKTIDEPRTNNLSELPIKKQVKDINNKPICDMKEILEIEEQRAYVEKYATNEYQIETFKLIESMPLANEIKSQAHIIALRVGSNATITDFVHAKSVLLNMALSSADGTSFDNVVAAFTKAYEKAKKRAEDSTVMKKDNSKTSEEKSPTGHTVPFYNWLKERSHSSGRAIYNWLTHH